MTNHFPVLIAYKSCAERFSNIRRTDFGQIDVALNR
jgi:hypothetical protein